MMIAPPISDEPNFRQNSKRLANGFSVMAYNISESEMKTEEEIAQWFTFAMLFYLIAKGERRRYERTSWLKSGLFCISDGGIRAAVIRSTKSTGMHQLFNEVW
jgi:hypothetical protein